MSAEQLLSELRALDVRLFVEGDRLRCSAPKGRLTADLEKRISIYKPELLLSLRSSAKQALTISKRPTITDGAPLSFAQERFWFLQNFDPGTTAYNITASYLILEPIDRIVLELALRVLVERHEILKTRFIEQDGAPIQDIQHDLRPQLEFHDFIDLADHEKENACNDFIQTTSKWQFDLEKAPLLRVALIRCSENEHLVVLTMHHIICDAWSIGIFFDELKSISDAIAQGRALRSPKLPIQYSDYALWEREQRTARQLSSQIDYWKSKLKGSPRYLDLPLDYQRSASTTYEGKLHRFQLGEHTSQTLRTLAWQEGATPFMVLLTVFKALLFRYTAQRDIVVGTPVSTRTHSELEHLVGCFINTHVLRTELPAGITTRELLKRVRATVLESLDNADVPFETLLTELVVERDLSRSPLFQVGFILQNTPMAAAFNVVQGGTTFDMTLYMWESNGLIGGCVEYNSSLFDPETISCFADCYVTLAFEMAAQPDSPMERISLLTPAQEERWFGKYNGEQTAIPNLCTHAWIEEQAEKTPDAIAVVFEQEELSYRELSERSNRLARRLRALGVGPNRLVAICLDRSLDLVVALLAVWKAGGAYVPLDPEFPMKRLAFMLEDSAATVLVTESRLLEKLPQALPAMICLDREVKTLQRESNAPLDLTVTPDDLAYVLYTSGSTGKPKGVKIAHRSLVNFLFSMQKLPGIDSTDRLLSVTTLSFDIAGLELYLPLVSGAQVVISPRATTLDGTALMNLMRDSKITLMQATPMTWRLLLEAGWKGTPGLKVLCGGEALTRDLADQLVATGSEVWNLYGPTETTIWSTRWRVTPQNERVPIGLPIANTTVDVLDEYGHPMPIGVSGELYIGGDGLAQGYLLRDELISERFIHSTFHDGQRLYRTGDLARRLPGGELECLGRVDHQVKLRGYRIELGEIEAALERHPAISQAVVVMREDRVNDQRLTAYITTTEVGIPEVAELRKELQSLLPGYMVPSAFVQLNAFPLTPNRKVDRKALAAPEYRPRFVSDDSGRIGHLGTIEQTAPDDDDLSRSRYVPPSSHVEFVMTEIWRDVLNIDRVGVLDNFFELGGHSLSAAKLVSRLRAALGMDLPLRCVFIDPTIAGLSRHIAYDPATREYRYTSEIPKWNCLVPAQPKGTRIPLFFVAGYQNPDDTLMILSRLIPNLGMDQPVFGFRPRWVEGNNEGYTSVEEMAREFLKELRAVQPKGPYLLGGYCVGGIAALEIGRLLMKEGEEVKLMVFLDTERPTTMRIFLTDLYFLRQRISHIQDVLLEILRGGDRSRVQILRDLLRRKFKIASSQETREADHFYQTKVRYRRLLYSYPPKQYPGRITLILNETLARVDKDLGWTGIAQEGLEVHASPGDHITILTKHNKELAQVILKSIDKALGEPSLQESRAEVGLA
ncbi:non-ribosomal peptide synthetase [Acidobacterium sp. S8]|uniref:non-ribosomal peptide synthetase n=1 Tax=Acidobacterium sp. S8 TaxID=1641854 RepID=UPI00131A9CC2|nr:non-ribosomal peptide synthetase [Acidobacterium sp. S8]